jgi:hypothetical protein
MVLAMTCFRAVRQSDRGFDRQRFLREQDKGAVAVFAASWTNRRIPTIPGC